MAAVSLFYLIQSYIFIPLVPSSPSARQRALISSVRITLFNDHFFFWFQRLEEKERYTFDTYFRYDNTFSAGKLKRHMQETGRWTQQKTAANHTAYLKIST